MPTPSPTPTPTQTPAPTSPPSLRPTDDEVKEVSVRERASSSPSSQAETAAIRRDISTADNPLTLILIVGSVVCVILAASLFILVKTGRREQQIKDEIPDHRPSPEISTRMAPYGVPPEYAAQLSPQPPAPVPIHVVAESIPPQRRHDASPPPVAAARPPKLELQRRSDALGGSFIDYNDPMLDVLTPRSDIITADPRASQMSDWFETRHTGVRRRSCSRPERDTISDFDRSTHGMLETSIRMTSPNSASVRMTSPTTASVHEVTFHTRGSGENDVFGGDDDLSSDEDDELMAAPSDPASVNAWSTAAKHEPTVTDNDRISDLHDNDTDTDIDDDRMSELHDYEADRASSEFFSTGSDWMLEDGERFSSEYAPSRPRATDAFESDRRMDNMSGFSDLHDDDADYEGDDFEEDYHHESRDDSYVTTRSTDASVVDIDIDDDGDDDHGDSF
ncbi:hypothetical protein P43SY_005964 [Pythium insidiosum]|uniref:Uncharacterized protein n=1 Tax=Pythium insidiosum TaxID=114742 RepID=A0AAD5Q8Z2_PYTIN|nr:hypothetical protein P43SY_005964 [Pythium insidiosum]